MGGVSTEARAERQEFLAGFVGFVVSFLGVFAAGLYVLIKHVIPEEGWLSVGFAILVITVYPVIGGMSGALGSMTIVSRLNYRRGAYRCYRCGRALRGIGIRC